MSAASRRVDRAAAAFCCLEKRRLGVVVCPGKRVFPASAAPAGIVYLFCVSEGAGGLGCRSWFNLEVEKETTIFPSCGR